MKIGLCQMKVCKDKKTNVLHAIDMIEKCIKKGAEIVILPEMFNCPYDNKYFREYSEKIEENKMGRTISTLKQCALKNKVYIIAGSIPEIDEKDRIFNTSVIIDDKGNVLDKHRKVHLFDIDVKGGVRFKESDTLTAGNKCTVVDTKWGKIGLMICYDIRFPELSRKMALKGAKIIFTPAAFNMTTGPSHWETLFKSRALDNQVYMVGVSPARDENSTYVAYGNSLVTNPWGKIISKLEEKENILLVDVSLEYEKEVREQIPVLKHRREEVYNL
ncbi:carbon-nitrogen hydrolase family protein [Clostridium oceanicum]|uniref:Carbon-nitrogen hydrolase family protein n=1 Tax=Clostridium oceanicum TaxID=1543 RepID=A0ABN1JN01_9CLOT